jgi:hypothetical protein
MRRLYQALGDWDASFLSRTVYLAGETHRSRDVRSLMMCGNFYAERTAGLSQYRRGTTGRLSRLARPLLTIVSLSLTGAALEVPREGLRNLKRSDKAVILVSRICTSTAQLQDRTPAYMI